METVCSHRYVIRRGYKHIPHELFEFTLHPLDDETLSVDPYDDTLHRHILYTAEKEQRAYQIHLIKDAALKLNRNLRMIIVVSY